MFFLTTYLLAFWKNTKPNYWCCTQNDKHSRCCAWFLTVMSTKVWSVGSQTHFYYSSRNYLRFIINHMMMWYSCSCSWRKNISARGYCCTAGMSILQKGWLSLSLCYFIQNCSARWVLFSCKLESLSYCSSILQNCHVSKSGLCKSSIFPFPNNFNGRKKLYWK